MVHVRLQYSPEPLISRLLEREKRFHENAVCRCFDIHFPRLTLTPCHTVVKSPSFVVVDVSTRVHITPFSRSDSTSHAFSSNPLLYSIPHAPVFNHNEPSRPLVGRGLVVHRTLEQEDVWFRLVYFVVFPTKTLQNHHHQHAASSVNIACTHLSNTKTSPFLLPQQLQGTSCTIKVFFRDRLEHLLG